MIVYINLKFIKLENHFRQCCCRKRKKGKKDPKIKAQIDLSQVKAV